ncbi:MAG TPA: ATP-binding protein [Candidatus Heimdallarchaeota archaeon]|nr:ATP-binding protein [Candidatus Heimdallarchaeota archaeon]
MKINLRLKDWNLKNKIVLHIVVIGITAGALLTYLYLSTQKNIIKTLTHGKAELVSSMIEYTVTHRMQEGKQEDVGRALQQIAGTEKIESLRIIDLTGKILESSQGSEIGNFIPEIQITKLNELYSTADKTPIPQINHISENQSIFAIQNRDECFVCHSPEKKIIALLEINLIETPTVEFIYKTQLRSVIISFLALGILIFITLRLFEKIINRPLSQLKNKMKQVQGGNLRVQLRPLKNDDIGDLTQSFNIMVANLRQAKQQIEELHDRELEKAGHLASIGELAAGLAHEIKNPIAGIKGALEVINQRTDPADPQKEIFTEILQQIDRIYNIVQDLLSYARPREINLKPINLNECIQRAVTLAQSQMQDKDIKFHFEKSKEDIQILCDENKIQEVVLNLLINSIAAIEEKGEISIGLNQKNDRWLEIAIRDDGKGIKVEHLTQVFNPFFTTRRRGTGLGLSICKKIIEAHKGSIDVQSEEGKGTVFTIRLSLINRAE